MLSYGDRIRRYKVEPIHNFNYWHDRIKKLLMSFTENYELIPTNQKSDVYFHDLIKDNLNSVKSIYSKNSFEIDKIANNEIKEYINIFVANDDRCKLLFDFLKSEDIFAILPEGQLPYIAIDIERLCQ